MEANPIALNKRFRLPLLSLTIIILIVAAISYHQSPQASENTTSPDFQYMKPPLSTSIATPPSRTNLPKEQSPPTTFTI